MEKNIQMTFNEENTGNTAEALTLTALNQEMTEETTIVSANDENIGSVELHLSDIENKTSENKQKAVMFVCDMITKKSYDTAYEILKRWHCANELLQDGSSLLDYCAGISSLKGTKVLLEAGADPTLKTLNHFSPLYRAVRYNKPELLQLYFEHLKKEQLREIKKDNDYVDNNSLLHIAVLYAGPKVIHMLLTHHFDPNKQNINGETALHLLDYQHHLESAKLFFNTPSAIAPNLSIRNKRGETVEQATHNQVIRRFLHQERKKELQARQSIPFEERRLMYLKKQAQKRISAQKALRELIRKNGGLSRV